MPIEKPSNMHVKFTISEVLFTLIQIHQTQYCQSVIDVEKLPTFDNTNNREYHSLFLLSS